MRHVLKAHALGSIEDVDGYRGMLPTVIEILEKTIQ